MPDEDCACEPIRPWDQWEPNPTCPVHGKRPQARSEDEAMETAWGLWSREARDRGLPICESDGSFKAGYRAALAVLREQVTGVELIAAERERQVSEEGWTPEHDDTHTVGELAMAAATYAFPWSFVPTHLRDKYSSREHLWPWDKDTFKPAGRGRNHHAERLRELSKAGALIAAEIDRLQRDSAAEFPSVEARSRAMHQHLNGEGS